MRTNEDIIIEIVSEYFNINIPVLGMKTREMHVIKARHIAMYLCYKYTNLSLTKTGNVFNKDHATVMHACKSVLNQMETNLNYAYDVNELIQRFKIRKVTEKTVFDEVYMQNDFFNDTPIITEPKKIAEKEELFISPFASAPEKEHHYAGSIHL